MGQAFPDYETFSAKFEQFTKSTYCHTYNYSRRKNKKDFDTEKFPFERAHLRCIHFGAPRVRKSNANGDKKERVNQHSNCVGCKFEIEVTFKSKELQYVVKKFTPDHENHELSKEAYMSASRGKKLTPEQEKFYTRLYNMQTPTNKLLEMIEEDLDLKYTIKDLHNVFAKQKRLGGQSRSDLERAIEYFESLKESDPGCTVKILYDTVGNDDNNRSVKAMYYASSYQKSLFKDHHQVMLVDGTYQLTIHGLVLYPFVTNDEHGKATIIGYAFVAAETAEILSYVLDLFIDGMGLDSTHEIKAVILDKDCAEMKACQEKLPNSAFVLCRFHVIKTVKERTSHIILPSEKQHLKQLFFEYFQQMLYAKDEALYMSAWARLGNLGLQHINLQAEVDYIDKQWHSIRAHWAFHITKTLPLLHNYTNNSTEALNKVIKDINGTNKQLDIVIKNLESLIKLQARNRSRKTYVSLNKVLNPTNVSTKEDHEVLKAQKYMTDTGLLKVRHELQKIGQVTEDLDWTEGQITCPLQPKPCAFSCTLGLPCRHLLRVKVNNGEPIITKDMVNPQFYKQAKTSFMETSKTGEKRQASDTIHQKLPKVSKSGKNNFSNLKKSVNNIISDFAMSSQEDQEAFVQDLTTYHESYKHGYRPEIFAGQNQDISTMEVLNNCHESQESSQIRYSIPTSQSKKSSKKSIVKPLTRHDKAMQFENKEFDYMKDTLKKFRSRYRGAEWNAYTLGVLTRHSDLDGDELYIEFPIIYSIQQIILKQFQSDLISPFQDYGNNQIAGLKPIEPGKKFVQLLYNGKNHYVTVTNMLPDGSVTPANEILLYDSLLSFQTNSTTIVVVEDEVKWQISRLLQNFVKNSENIKIKAMSCEQQPNMIDCGFYALMNVIAILYQMDPSQCQYPNSDSSPKGDIRQEFFSYLDQGNIYKPKVIQKTGDNQVAFQPRTMQGGHPTNVHFNSSFALFSIHCHCRLPESYGTLLTCGSCKLKFHTQCYLLDGKSKKEIDFIRGYFQCYSCRAPGDTCSFIFESNEEKISDKELTTISSSILKIPSHNYNRYMTHVVKPRAESSTISQENKGLAYSKIHFEKLADFITKYDINSLVRKTGSVFEAIFNWASNNQQECEIQYNFQDLTDGQIVHLGLLLVAHVTSTNIFPVWPFTSEMQSNFYGKNLKEKVARNKCVIKNLREQDAILTKELSSIKGEIPEDISLRIDQFQDDVQSIINGITSEINWRENADRECNTQLQEARKLLRKFQNFISNKKLITDTCSKKSRSQRKKQEPYTPPEFQGEALKSQDDFVTDIDSKKTRSQRMKKKPYTPTDP